MDKTDGDMQGTWSGGTDMLIRAVDYILLAETQAEMPCLEQMAWDPEVKVGQVGGKIHGAAAVDLARDGTSTLFVAADNGDRDRLFRWDGKGFEEVTGKAGLTAKSQLFAWGDFDGDGRVDLASWDGGRLTIHLQDKEGRFGRQVVGGAGECVGLATVDVGGGKAGLVVSGKGVPGLMTLNGGDALGRPIVTGEFGGKDLGEAGECLVADFDGDGWTDVMQMFSRGRCFIRGKRRGRLRRGSRRRLGWGRDGMGRAWGIGMGMGSWTFSPARRTGIICGTTWGRGSLRTQWSCRGRWSTSRSRAVFSRRRAILMPRDGRAW